MAPRLINIVVPCHDEVDTVRLFHERVCAAMAGRAEDFRFIFVDDGSVDGTRRELAALAASDARVSWIGLSRNFGKEAALSAGIDRARGDALIVMDADLQHPPELIPAMLEAWKTGGFMVVDGVKRSRGWESPLYALAAGFFNRVMSGSSAMDLRGSSDFKLLDRAVADVIRAVPERTRFFRGLTEWAGFRHIALPYDVAQRVAGMRSWSVRKLARYSIDNVLVFSSAPLRLISSLGLWTVVLTIVLAAQTLWMKLSGRAVEGFTTVILAVAFFSGVILLCLGVMGEYLARVYDELKGRPRYVIEDEGGRDGRD